MVFTPTSTRKQKKSRVQKELSVKKNHFYNLNNRTSVIFLSKEHRGLSCTDSEVCEEASIATGGHLIEVVYGPWGEPWAPAQISQLSWEQAGTGHLDRKTKECVGLGAYILPEVLSKASQRRWNPGKRGSGPGRWEDTFPTRYSQSLETVCVEGCAVWKEDWLGTQGPKKQVLGPLISDLELNQPPALVPARPSWSCLSPVRGLERSDLAHCRQYSSGREGACASSLVRPEWLCQGHQSSQVGRGTSLPTGW